MKIIPIDSVESPQLVAIPLYTTQVAASFRVLQRNYIESAIDLNKHIIKRPAAFFARASGSSMLQIGILDGDLMVVDRSVTLSKGSVVIASIDGELTCKIFDKHRQRLIIS